MQQTCTASVFLSLVPQRENVRRQDAPPHLVPNSLPSHTESEPYSPTPAPSNPATPEQNGRLGHCHHDNPSCSVYNSRLRATLSSCTISDKKSNSNSLPAHTTPHIQTPYDIYGVLPRDDSKLDKLTQAGPTYPNTRTKCLNRRSSHQADTGPTSHFPHATSHVLNYRRELPGWDIVA